MEMAFKASFLGVWFTHHVIAKEGVSEAEQPFDVSKLSLYHHSLPPGDVHLNHNHPLTEWLDKLRDHTGCHSLSPPPLVPYPSHGGTVMHALSCALVGTEMYWHSISNSIAQVLCDKCYRDHYSRLLPGGSEELDGILSGIRIDGSSCAGLEVDYHPLLLYVASRILHRVVLLIDPWALRPSAPVEWPVTCGIFEPDMDVHCDRLPPLCLTWESAER
jgi:hypothetical protein